MGGLRMCLIYIYINKYIYIYIYIYIYKYIYICKPICLLSYISAIGSVCVCVCVLCVCVCLLPILAVFVTIMSKDKIYLWSLLYDLFIMAQMKQFSLLLVSTYDHKNILIF